MDEELRKRIADYFDPGELVEFLQVDTSDVVERFEEEIEEVLDEVLEFMEIGTRR